MYFTDPTSTRIVHNARLIEAKQARTPHRREQPNSRQPAWSRFLSLGASLRRRDDTNTSPLSDSLELFAGHNRDQLTRLRQFLTVIDVPAGTTLGRQGRIAREFVTILHGEVGVTIDGVPHAVLDDGSHFGAVALLSEQAGELHSASFTVMTPTTIAVANPAEFHSMLAGFPLIDQRVRAMTDVRRAYLAGLAHDTAGQPVEMKATVGEYPVHAIELAHYV